MRTITLKKPLVFGCRLADDPGGLGTTETCLPVGTRVRGNGQFWEVIRDTEAMRYDRDRGGPSSAKGRRFSSISLGLQ